MKNVSAAKFKGPVTWCVFVVLFSSNPGLTHTNNILDEKIKYPHKLYNSRQG